MAHKLNRAAAPVVCAASLFGVGFGAWQLDRMETRITARLERMEDRIDRERERRAEIVLPDDTRRAAK